VRFACCTARFCTTFRVEVCLFAACKWFFYIKSYHVKFLAFTTAGTSTVQSFLTCQNCSTIKRVTEQQNNQVLSHCIPFHMRSNAAHRWCSGLATLVRSYAKAAGISGGKRLGLADVQHVVAVASGKGGVGKSTVAGEQRQQLPTSAAAACCLVHLYWSDNPLLYSQAYIQIYIHSCLFVYMCMHVIVCVRISQDLKDPNNVVASGMPGLPFCSQLGNSLSHAPWLARRAVGCRHTWAFTPNHDEPTGRAACVTRCHPAEAVSVG
jgi:hypothetical protein